MTYRKKLTLSFFLILSFQTLLSISLTYFSISELLRDQNRTILEEGGNQQQLKFNDIFKNLTKDLYFYKFLMEEQMKGKYSEELMEDLLDQCLQNTVAHTAIIYSEEGEVLLNRKVGIQLKNFNILNSPYSLLDFRFPNTRISWSHEKDDFEYFGLISGTRILIDNKVYYLIFFTDFKKHFQQISERQPEVLTVFSLDNRILYSDFPGVAPFAHEAGEWGEAKIGNDIFLVYGKPVWSNGQDVVTLSVLYSITAEKNLMNRLIRLTIFIFSFIGIIAFVIALQISRIFSTPLINLNNSLKTYLDHGYFPRINYKKGNEMAFLISSFENLTKKIVDEEQQIRDQMEQIQFLNKYNKNLIESIQTGIIVLDHHGVVEFCNSYMKEILNVKEERLMGTHYRVLLSKLLDRDLPSMQQLVEIPVITGLHLPGSDEERAYSLKMSPFYSSDHLEKLIMVLEDTTETDRRWEESLLIDRISSMSMLSAGMAHEINNPLASIQTNLDYLNDIEEDSDKKDSIKWIKDGVDRISSIVSNTARYTMAIKSKETEKIAAVARETADLILRGNTHRKGDIRFSCEENLPPVRLGEDLFKQLILNLLLNSMEASSKGELIEVHLEKREEGRTVIMKVQDWGKGIPQDILPKVFNPFFTYGKKNKGTGLGLSVCHGIVTRAGGKIKIESEPGKGTIVTVEIKACEYTHS